MKDYKVITSRVRLARNFADVKFPSRATAEEARFVAEKVYLAGKSVTQGRLYAMEELDDSERSYLVERRLISPALASAPYGAAFLSKDKRLSVMCMEEDHVRVQSFLPGLSLRECFEIVKEYDLALRTHARLAFDKKLGYLTACPTNVGTGMRASVMMFLPGITALGKVDELEEELKKANLTIRGALGEGSQAEGFLYQISNGVSLGVSEDTILNRVESAAERIIKIEDAMLDAYYKRDKIRLEDTIYRSYAILKAARTLSEKELASLVVNLKIGVLLGLIELGSVNADELVMMCSPLGIVRNTHCADTPAERDVARAAFVRKILNEKEG